MKLRAPTKRPIVLPAVNPNAGLQALYRRELQKLIDEMQKSIAYWIIAAYRKNEPEISKGLAMDDSPARTLQKVMKNLSNRWMKRFDEASIELAKYFSTAVKDRTDSQLKKILKDGGFTVSFTASRAMNDMLQATIGEQVGLIKSIAQQHLSEVQGLVMRSVQKGGDLGELSKQLQQRYDVTSRRAALIARDQNNKATAMLTRARQNDLGLYIAKWRHSHGGKEPRPTHVANDGNTYDIRKGWYDPEAVYVKGGGRAGQWIWPGELINCCCRSQTIIPGFQE